MDDVIEAGLRIGVLTEENKKIREKIRAWLAEHGAAITP